MEMSLASRWLDLDRIAGASEGASPLDSIIPLAIGLRDLLPADSRSRATFCDRSGQCRPRGRQRRCAWSLARSDDRLAIEELRLGLPGGSRGELQGVVTGPPDAPVFDGSIGLRGTSLVRFLGWATAGAAHLRSQGRRHVRRSRAAVDRRRARGRAQYHRRPLGDRDLGGRAIPLGRPAGGDRSLSKARSSMRAPSSRPDRAWATSSTWCCTGRSWARRQPPRAWAPPDPAGAARRPTPSSASAPDSSSPPRAPIATSPWRSSSRAAGCGCRCCGSRATRASASSSKARWTMPPRVPKGSRARRRQRRLRAPRSLPWPSCSASPKPFRPDARRAQAMVPLRLGGSMAFGARTPTSADLVARRGDQRGRRQAQRPARRRPGWLALGPGRRDRPRRGQRRASDRRRSWCRVRPRAAPPMPARGAWWSKPPACPARGWCRWLRWRPAISPSISGDG